VDVAEEMGEWLKEYLRWVGFFAALSEGKKMCALIVRNYALLKSLSCGMCGIRETLLRLQK
jgi:hypothetical protein